MMPVSGVDLKINFWFHKGTDIGMIADTILEKVKGLTAFNDATEHKHVSGKALYVSKHEHINVFTDYESFISIHPTCEDGYGKVSWDIIESIIRLDEFTEMDGEDLVVPIA